MQAAETERGLQMALSSWWMFRASYQSERRQRVNAIISKLMVFESYKFFSLLSSFDLNGLWGGRGGGNPNVFFFLLLLSLRFW